LAEQIKEQQELLVNLQEQRRWATIKENTGGEINEF